MNGTLPLRGLGSPRVPVEDRSLMREIILSVSLCGVASCLRGRGRHVLLGSFLADTVFPPQVSRFLF